MGHQRESSKVDAGDGGGEAREVSRASVLGAAKKSWTRLSDLTRRLTKAFIGSDTCKEI